MRWVLSVLLAVVLASPVAAANPNIVLIVCDDLSPTLGCYGDAAIKTPHIDRLAADGVRFTQAFCTTASCSASRSVILTGLHNHANAHYGHEHSYHHFRAYDNLKSLPVLLSEAGYRTGRIGKLHVGPPEVFKFDQVLAGNERNAVAMANNCRDFVSVAHDRPFFLYFCPADPHRSGEIVQDEPHQPNAFGNRRQGFPGVETMLYDPATVRVPSFLPETPVCRAELSQYCQSVSRIDQGVGRLVQVLRDAGRYDDTLIVFTSDHGMAFPGAKTTVYEGGLRIPMIVRAPNAPRRGETCDAMVSLVDMMPTLLDFAGGLPTHTKFHGRSWLSTLKMPNPAGWDEIYASHTFHEITMYYPMRVVRNRRHKLIWNIAHGLPFPFASDLWEAPTWQDVYQRGPTALYGKRTVDAYIHRPRFELYDLEQDPDETVNLAKSPESAPLLQEMQAKLKAFQTATNDPWRLKWDYE